jgi:thiol-disulfide isomerase/thioredoxin
MRLFWVLLVFLTLTAGWFGRASAQESGIAVGARAPVVTVNDLDGKPVDLGQYIGKKPVFLEFWATWCELCEELLPQVRAAQAAYGSKVEFIGVNVTVNQSPQRVRKYLETHKPGFRTLYDTEGTSIRAYKVPATSYVAIVDPTGKVAYTGSGGTQDFEPVLRTITQDQSTPARMK